SDQLRLRLDLIHLSQPLECGYEHIILLLTTMSSTSSPSAFGSLFTEYVVSARTVGGEFRRYEVQHSNRLEIHAATHALHYASTCFEGLKAYKWADGTSGIFRLRDHIRRL